MTTIFSFIFYVIMVIARFLLLFSNSLSTCFDVIQ
jgi:hypothetical protein